MKEYPSFPFYDHKTQAKVPMTDHARFVADQDDLIVAYTAAGICRQDIADRIGCTVWHVSVRRRAMGLT